MNKPIIKAICRVLNEKVNRIHYGYEMDCLISAEFTPSPDYEPVFDKAQEICHKGIGVIRISQEGYMTW